MDGLRLFSCMNLEAINKLIAVAFSLCGREKGVDIHKDTHYTCILVSSMSVSSIGGLGFIDKKRLIL